MEHKAIQSLSEVRSGQKVKLVSVEAGRSLVNRLVSMGLLPNVEITVINNSHPGPFVINVKGSKIMLGRGMANKIMVCDCDYEKDHSGSGRKS
jgi:Fe2+ transport system protein FeoA